MHVSGTLAEMALVEDIVLTNRVRPASILQFPDFDRATLRRGHYTFTDVAPNDLKQYHG